MIKMVRKVNIIVLCLFIVCSCKNKDEKTKPDQPTSDQPGFIDYPLAEKANNLFTLIRDRKINKDSSVVQLNNLLNQTALTINRQGIKKYDPDKWIYPINGYSVRLSLGKEKDEAYQPGTYNIFDGNDHTGHAALDLFVEDKNQDCLDDINHKPFEIVSMTAGVILSTETSWDTASPLRGGKYMWIYDPYNKFLIYYAHCNSILVKPGQIIRPGDVIATCGRSGLNAFKKRSPTHLHLTLLKLDQNNYPKPVNPYPYLLGAKTKE